MKNTIRLGLLTLALAPCLAQAATATTTMAVTTTVLSACTIIAAPLAFGSYDPTAATNTDGVATVSVLCTSGTSYAVGLSAGTGTGATVSNRKMTSGANLLPYALYSNAGRTTNWGNTPGTDTLAGTATGLLQPLSVYGRITPQETVPTGAYVDTVTATVNY